MTRQLLANAQQSAPDARRPSGSEGRANHDARRASGSEPRAGNDARREARPATPTAMGPVRRSNSWRAEQLQPITEAERQAVRELPPGATLSRRQAFVAQRLPESMTEEVGLANPTSRHEYARAAGRPEVLPPHGFRNSNGDFVVPHRHVHHGDGETGLEIGVPLTDDAPAGLGGEVPENADLARSSGAAGRVGMRTRGTGRLLGAAGFGARGMAATRGISGVSNLFGLVGGLEQVREGATEGERREGALNAMSGSTGLMSDIAGVAGHGGPSGVLGGVSSALSLGAGIHAVNRGQGEAGWRQVAGGVGGGLAVAGGVPLAGTALGVGMGVGGVAGAVANAHAARVDPTGRGRDATDEAMDYAEEQGYARGSVTGAFVAGAAAIGTTGAALVEGGLDWLYGRQHGGNHGPNAVPVQERR